MIRTDHSFLRPIMLAVTVIMAGSGPLCAQGPLRAATLPRFDRVYQQSLGTMQSEARAVGLRIDTDIDVLVSTATSHVLLATIDGFENIVLKDTGLNEFDFAFAGVGGIEGLPDGYYGCTTSPISPSRRRLSSFSSTQRARFSLTRLR